MKFTTLTHQPIEDNDFGLKILHVQKPQGISELLLNESNIQETKQILREHGFLKNADDLVRHSAGTYYMNINGQQIIGQNVRLAKYNKNLFWHKDILFEGDIGIILHYPGKKHFPNLPLTGVGREEVVTPIIAKNIENLVDTLKEQFGTKIIKSLKSTEENCKQIYSIYIEEMAHSIFSSERKIPKNKGEILINTFISAYQLFEQYKDLNIKQLRVLSNYLLKFFERLEKFNFMDRFYNAVDLDLGSNVYRHSWKPLDTLLIYNNNMLHSRIPLDNSTLNPIYRFVL